MSTITLKSDSPLEAYAHCCTELQIREFLENLTERGRLRTHAHIALARALESNKESPGVVRALLEQPEVQVNLPLVGQDGNCVLHIAVLLQDKDAVRLLLKRTDLDPNVGNGRDETPLHLAAKPGCCPHILELLASDPRVNVGALTSDKQTALHVACRGDKVDVVSQIIVLASKTVRSVPQFLKRKELVGRTALHYAAESGLDETVGKILDALARDDQHQLALAQDSQGFLAIHLAAQQGTEGHVRVVQRLLKFGDGLTSLHHIFRSGRHSILQECVATHCSLPNREYNTLEKVVYLYLELLTVTSHRNMAEFLLSNLYKSHIKSRKGCPGSLLHWTVLKDVGDEHGLGALLIRHILKWDPEEAKRVLDKDNKRTALHISTIVKNHNAVRALVSSDSSGAWYLDGNKKDVHNNTALDYAFKTRNDTIQRTLMERKDVRERHARLHKNREHYVIACNAILVVAVLIASETYKSCLTAAEVKKQRDDNTLPPTDWAQNTLVPGKIAFFLSMMSTILAAFAALPFSLGFFFVQTVDDNYVRMSLYRTRVLIVLASYCLVLSVGAVMFGFVCSQHMSPYVGYMCAKACRIVVVMFLCLSVVFLTTNAVTFMKSSKGRKLWSRRGRWRRLQVDEQQYEVVGGQHQELSLMLDIIPPGQLSPSKTLTRQ